VTLEQTNSDTNLVVYLGSFDFNVNWNNSVAIKIVPTDYPVQKVALDSLIVVYEGDLGTGGGPALPPDDGETVTQLQTIFSDGSLNFSYEGTYNYPRLICYGSDLENLNPLFNNGVKSATVDVLDSSSVYCNIQFEDGSWMGQWYGILPGQKLFVNDIEITSALDNNQGGTNLVFNLDVDTGDGGTIVPPVDGDTTHDYNIHISGKVDGLGCNLSNGARADGEINLLFMFLPFILVFMIRATQRLRSN
jgi:hypothetical protein